MDKIVKKAVQKAKETGKAMIVFSIDSEDTRELSVAPESYQNDPEFIAFDGEVEAIVYPDGEVEHV